VIRRLMGFGSHIALVGVLGTVLRNVDYLLIGRVLGTRALGLYTLAFRMPQLVVEGIATIVGQVAFPAFARVQDDPDRLRSGLLRGLRLSALAVVPLGVGLALVAGPSIHAVYGERWEPAIDVMRLLALYMVVQAASRLCGDVYKAIGRARLLSGLAVLKLAITVPLLAVAVHDGIVAVAAAQLVAAVACTAIDLVVAIRTIGVSTLDLLRAYAPSLRAGAALAAVGVAVDRATSGAPRRRRRRDDTSSSDPRSHHRSAAT
jgi:lipopolysaccharide exporter